MKSTRPQPRVYDADEPPPTREEVTYFVDQVEAKYGMRSAPHDILIRALILLRRCAITLKRQPRQRAQKGRRWRLPRFEVIETEEEEP